MFMTMLVKIKVFKSLKIVLNMYCAITYCYTSGKGNSGHIGVSRPGETRDYWGRKYPSSGGGRGVT